MSNNLKSEVIETLIFFCDTDLKMYGYITAGTLEAFKTQGVELPQQYQLSRRMAYENEICKKVNLPASCNCCDRIIFEGDKFFEGGYCEDCAATLNSLNERTASKLMAEIKTII